MSSLRWRTTLSKLEWNLTCPSVVSQFEKIYAPNFYLGFLGGASGKEPACQCRRHKRHRFNPLVDPLEEGIATHSSTLAWRIPWTEEPGRLWSIGVQRVRHNCNNLAHMLALGKEMATHSSTLAWRIPGTKQPGGLPSIGLHRIGHDWSDLAAAAAEKTNKSTLNIHWKDWCWS